MHVCVCVSVHALSWLYGKACAHLCKNAPEKRERVHVFRAPRHAQCVILCAVVCVGRYQRMQDGK